MKRINEKVRNKETHTLTETEKEAKPKKSAEVIDLMDSVEAEPGEGRKGQRPRRPPPGARQAPRQEEERRSRVARA